MQYQDDEENNTMLPNEKNSQQPELRNPWRALLDAQYLQPSDQSIVQANAQERWEGYYEEATGGHIPESEGDLIGTPLQYDPWNALVQSQGIEIVDLQQVRSHTVQEPVDNLDVEQALDFMQERPVNDTSKP